MFLIHDAIVIAKTIVAGKAAVDFNLLIILSDPAIEVFSTRQGLGACHRFYDFMICSGFPKQFQFRQKIALHIYGHVFLC